MHSTVPLRSLVRRLIPAVYGVAKSGIRTHMLSETLVPCTVGDDAFLLSSVPSRHLLGN